MSLGNFLESPVDNNFNVLLPTNLYNCFWEKQKINPYDEIGREVVTDVAIRDNFWDKFASYAWLCATIKRDTLHGTFRLISTVTLMIQRLTASACSRLDT